MRRWLIFSLLLNLAMIGVAAAIIVYKGGVRWLEGLVVSTQPVRFSQTSLYQGRVDTFQKVPDHPGAWVFLGDSLIDYAPTQELIGAQAINRGIAGDLVADMAKRAAEVSRHTPAVVVLWGGTNDLLAGLECDQVVHQILDLAKVLKSASPQAQVLILGPPPVADRLAENPPGFRGRVECVNRRLGERISEVDARFGDPASILADTSGALSTIYGFDGIHLNGEGYLAWSAWLLSMLPRQTPKERDDQVSRVLVR